ncbi:putative metalloprotease with PDZ domain [Pontibacter ummariensis]|uniref:Predicted metalloprotease, contains C-terminal PDZ domain n=1 Tax=Pontibacter ummariensis TaxID=1610492 RepID=A0A239D777_9BACT|nr:peptidase M61 [Pontibacter ummariensis]PRY14284.1 putative metalloprotease with PDZ domain [Pontibacter ummariensis]SNS28180.1 Predicted metalloprotease, contains C-terminal PDZ domain [Pontibacter ummariensis]
MLKKTGSILALCLSLSMAAFANGPQTQVTDKYGVTLDLANVQDDKVQVTVQAPPIDQETIVYNMPKIVPGTYSISDFGRFVSDFKAYGKNGQELTVEQLDTNRWKISKANQLDRITYWVDDTFDSSKPGDPIFEPGGTNIEADKNFLLNTFGFIGYFDDKKQVPYELNIRKPRGFYGSTPLKAVASTDTTDQYLIANYVDLADSPLMYNRPDTTVLNLGGTEVLVSVYSPSGRVTSAPIATDVKEILEAQRSYLGGTLPVDKYAFLIYVPEKVGKSGSFGALEHSYSSVYFLPEMPEKQFSSTIRDVAAHEFFHIVTPLNIHSEEIGNFDFIEPQMSKHLWLYEGVTEYFASHVQAYENLFELDEFLNKLREYIITSKAYYNDTLPLTEMSAQVLDKYAKEYGNVYNKGALIGLALDVKLRELSEGRYGLRDLMQDLAQTYGKEKAFKDEELFDKIAELTYPEIREFFARYVEGSEPLPLEETFRKVGILYEPVATQTINSYGGFVPGFDQESGKITVAETSQMDAFGKKLGFREGDLLLELNGTEITPMNVRDLFGDELQQLEPGEKITFTVGRKNKKGKLKEKKLKGKVTPVERSAQHVLRVDPNATQEQLELRAAWLNNPSAQAAP